MVLSGIVTARRGCGSSGAGVLISPAICAVVCDALRSMSCRVPGSRFVDSCSVSCDNTDCTAGKGKDDARSSTAATADVCVSASVR